MGTQWAGNHASVGPVMVSHDGTIRYACRGPSHDQHSRLTGVHSGRMRILQGTFQTKPQRTLSVAKSVIPLGQGMHAFNIVLNWAQSLYFCGKNVFETKSFKSPNFVSSAVSVVQYDTNRI